MKAKDPGTVDLWELIHLFRDNLGKISLCLLLCLGVGVFYLKNARPVYASSALLEIVPDDNGQEHPNAGVTNLDTSTVLRTINLKIASQSVLLRVIKNNRLADDPDFTRPQPVGGLISPEAARWWGEKTSGFLRLIGAERFLDPPAPDVASGGTFSDVDLVHKLASSVSVRQVRGSRLIALTVEHHDPRRARRLAQSVIDEFFLSSREDRSANLHEARELLLAEVGRTSEALRISEEKLESYRKQSNAVSLEDQQNIVVDRLRELNRQVAEAQNLRLAIQPEAEQVRQAGGGDPSRLLGIRRIAELPEIVELRKQITLLEAQEATLAKRYGPRHPTMVQTRGQLAELRSSLEAGLRHAGERIVQSHEAATATETALRAALAEQEQASMELGRIAIPYHALEREVQANATMYQKVLASLKQLDARSSLMRLNDADGIDIRVIEEPLVPNRPIRPRYRLTLALAAAAGLLLGWATALVARALDNTVSSVDAAESFLGLPVLATVPRSRHRRMTAMPAVVEHPASAEAEAFRSLRTSLSLLPGLEDEKCVLFTSAVPGEGKSYCSLNTAATFAQQGFRTLLIDADLRRPGLVQLLVGWNEAPGLTDCLQHAELFDTAVQQTAVPNLSVLGDRFRHPAGAGWLGKGGMGDVLARARAGYERIVIDTAPLMAVSDALCIVKHVSTVCLVVHAGHTQRRLVRRAVRQLEEVAQRAATGVILNMAGRQLAAGHYYYYTAPAKA